MHNYVTGMPDIIFKSYAIVRCITMTSIRRKKLKPKNHVEKQMVYLEREKNSLMKKIIDLFEKNRLKQKKLHPKQQKIRSKHKQISFNHRRFTEYTAQLKFVCKCFFNTQAGQPQIDHTKTPTEMIKMLIKMLDRRKNRYRWASPTRREIEKDLDAGKQILHNRLVSNFNEFCTVRSRMLNQDILKHIQGYIV